MTVRPPRGVRSESAEAAFRGDAGWRGGDDAYSIALDAGRRLWLFGDSFIDVAGSGRPTATFIHNSVAIQDAASLGPGALDFHWSTAPDGTPSSFFPDRHPDYLWPGHGAVVDDVLVLFFMVTRDAGWQRTSADEVETLAFFDSHDWDAVIVRDPAAPPASWRPEPVRRPPIAPAPLLGSAGVFLHDDHLYAHAVSRPHAYLCRWGSGAVGRGDLTRPQWWCGDRGWVADDGRGPAVPPVATIAPAETEFTVHWDPTRRAFVHVQLRGLGGPGLELRTAPRPEGPWSAPIAVDYDPDPTDAGDRFSYAGKAHPGLGDGDTLVVTHNTIHVDLAGIRTHDDLYWPRVVEVTGDW